jgi:hypothetical protein
MSIMINNECHCPYFSSTRYQQINCGFANMVFGEAKKSISVLFLHDVLACFDTILILICLTFIGHCHQSATIQMWVTGTGKFRTGIDFCSQRSAREKPSIASP